ncbi:MAG: HAMP domain-containing histidine kinase [Prevotella sp.]|nr:HAMP domain-containing histidine kinase [Prevotella sp.]
MSIFVYIVLGVSVVALLIAFVRHQRKLKVLAHLMQEAIRNRDFTFRLPTRSLLWGERAMQETLNHLGNIVRQQVNQSEVESWERLTRVLTHEIMNATAPITSISQSMLGRTDVKGTPLEDGVRAINETSRHLSDFVANYRKLSELERPVLADVPLRSLLDDISKLYPQLSWTIAIPDELSVHADSGMLRQVLMNIVKNAVEAQATKIVVDSIKKEPYGASYDSHQVLLFVGNNGLPVPPEHRQSLFVPFFTTKRSGHGIGLSLSRRMMVLQGGMLELCDQPRHGCPTAFLLTIPLSIS